MHRNGSRSYLLTGASSEIGRALLRRIVEQSENRLLYVSRQPVDLPSPCSCTTSGLDRVDLTDASALDRLRRHAEDFFSEPFTVIHSVGNFWRHRQVVSVGLDEAAEQIASHYLTLYGVVHHLLPVMTKLGGGRIVALSCNSVGYQYPDMAAFTCAKAAVDCLIRCIANEYSGQGIVANALALPTILTEQVRTMKPQGDHGHYLRPEELADIILDTVHQMSGYVNGNVIKVFKHSPSFYNQSYFERNPREP